MRGLLLTFSTHFFCCCYLEYGGKQWEVTIKRRECQWSVFLFVCSACVLLKSTTLLSTQELQFLSSAEISEIGLISGMKLGVKCLSAPLAWLPSSPYTTTHHLGSSEVIKNSGGICENSRIQGLWISRTEWIESDFHMCVAESLYIYQWTSELHQCTIYILLDSIASIETLHYFLVVSTLVHWCI